MNILRASLTPFSSTYNKAEWDNKKKLIKKMGMCANGEDGEIKPQVTKTCALSLIDGATCNEKLNGQILMKISY